MKKTTISKSICDLCHQLYSQATAGHDGLCPVCAEKTAKTHAVESIQFPKVYASETKSQFGSAALFTVQNSYALFDATAPGMTPALALARAQYAADAINQHAALLAVAEAAQELDNAINEPSLNSDVIAVSDTLREALANLESVKSGGAK